MANITQNFDAGITFNDPKLQRFYDDAASKLCVINYHQDFNREYIKGGTKNNPAYAERPAHYLTVDYHSKEDELLTKITLGIL